MPHADGRRRIELLEAGTYCWCARLTALLDLSLNNAHIDAPSGAALNRAGHELRFLAKVPKRSISVLPLIYRASRQCPDYHNHRRQAAIT